MKILISVLEGKDTLSAGIEYLKKIGHNVSITTRISEKTDKQIKDCDLMLIDISDISYKQGYEIAKALDEKKGVILLESENSNTSKSIPKNKSLIYKKFSSNNIVSVLQRAIKEAESKLDSKFILIISPEIERYLEWAAQNKRMHKAQIVRNAVEQMMQKDKDYKNYLD